METQPGEINQALRRIRRTSMSLRAKYSPEQERDDHGRFGTGSGASIQDAASTAIPTAQLRKIVDGAANGGIRPLGDPSQGNNPRYIATVGGQDYFVKLLLERISGGSPAQSIQNGLAARAMAVELGMATQTVPIAPFTDSSGDLYLAQPLVAGAQNGMETNPDPYVQALSPQGAGQLVAYQYLAGVGDQHAGQQLYVPGESNPDHAIKLNDFDSGFPPDGYVPNMQIPDLWDTMNRLGTPLDKTAMDVSEHRTALLSIAKDAGLSSDQVSGLTQRMRALTTYAVSNAPPTVKGFVTSLYNQGLSDGF